jgi:hypothetical protein
MTYFGMIEPINCLLVAARAEMAVLVHGDRNGGVPFVAMPPLSVGQPYGIRATRSHPGRRPQSAAAQVSNISPKSAVMANIVHFLSSQLSGSAVALSSRNNTGVAKVKSRSKPSFGRKRRRFGT